MSLQGRRLAPTFNFGCLRFEGADAVEVEDGFWSAEEAEATLRLSASYPPGSPWRGAALVAFFMFRLPAGREEFEETVGRYRERAKLKVRVPGVGPFAEDVLQPLDLPDGWTHDCFARGGRDLFHVYQGDSLGLMIRWSCQGGDVSDHPLLGGLAPTVRLVPGQWATDPPERHDAPDAEREDGDEPEPDGDFKPAIDLRGEAEAFRTFLKTRLSEFRPDDNFGPGEGGPVTLTTVGADAGQGGWVAVVFDTRPAAQPDGKWTLYLDEGVTLDRPHWTGCWERLCEDGEVAVTGLDGVTTAETDPDAFGARLGRTLAGVVAEERAALPPGVPSAREAWSVEDFDGAWAYFGPHGDDV
ncbi:hypothetical protein CA12_15900 [Alienimonas californiensis]|uniref:Uncharacterized protein n=2 Tax=Alienimonas californiensis TaxID=2527989 RepID=A0A517P838_9PLAN|nr:hypothetical protein CA12_15900 [Alienimonas californiensis]